MPSGNSTPWRLVIDRQGPKSYNTDRTCRAISTSLSCRHDERLDPRAGRGDVKIAGCVCLDRDGYAEERGPVGRRGTQEAWKP